MNPALTGYIARQRQAIIGEIGAMDRLPPIVAVLDLKVLTDYWFIRRKPVIFQHMPGFPSGVIQRGPVANWLWYDPAKEDYRRAFQSFLNTVQGVAQTLPSDWHVDHVYNRARARRFGYRLVRMALVEGHINTDHGRAYEAAIGAADRGRRPKIMKLLDAMTELKLFGIRSLPTGGSLTTEQSLAADVAARAYGITPDQARSGIGALRFRADQGS